MIELINDCDALVLSLPSSVPADRTYMVGDPAESDDFEPFTSTPAECALTYVL